MEPSMIIKTKSGNEYALLNREYLSEIKANEPAHGAFSVDALAQINNCGWIICYPEINAYFGIYEPVDDEYELDEVYDKLSENVSESLHTHRRMKRINEAFEEKFNREKEINTIYDEIAQAVYYRSWAYWKSRLYNATAVVKYIQSLWDSWTESMRSKNSDKMYEYKQNGSNPERLVKSIKSLDKLVYRSVWCKEHTWVPAEPIFKQAALDMINEQFKDYLDAKDNEEVARKQLYDDDFAGTNTDEYKPKKRDWEKMVDYMNRKSDPNRVAQSCKDANKCVARYIIAKALGWEGAITSFAYRVKQLGILNQAQLDAYAEKYKTVNIPDEYKELVDDLKAFDVKGGLANAGKRKLQAFNLHVEQAFDNNISIETYESIESNPSCDTLHVFATDGDEFKVKLSISYMNRSHSTCEYGIHVYDMDGNTMNLDKSGKWCYVNGYFSKVNDLIEHISKIDFNNLSFYH